METEGTGSTGAPQGASGAPESGTTGTAGAGQQGAGSAAPASNAGTGEQNSGQQTEDIASLPTWAQTLIRNTRQEAAHHRAAGAERAESAANAARDDVLKQLGRALGFVKDNDAPPDPAKLAADLESRNSALRAAQTELTVYRSAAAAGADPDALLDSRAFLDSVADLDPAANDYQQKIRDRIKAALEKTPRLRATPVAPAKGGGEITGGSQESTDPKSDDDFLALARNSRRRH